MTENDQQPFSEEAALRALDDLQRQIEQSRVRRRHATDAFDRFLRSFDRREPPPPIAPPVVPAAPAAAPVPPPQAVSLAASIVDAAPDGVAERERRAEDEVRTHPETDDTLVAAPPQSPFPAQSLTWPPVDLPPHPGVDHDSEAPTMLTGAVGDPPPLLRVDGWEPHGEPSAATAAFHSESDIAAITEATIPRETRAVPAALRAPATRRGPRIPPVVGLLAVVVAAAALFFVWRANSRDAQASAALAGTAASASQPTAAQAPAVAPAVVVTTPAAEVSAVRKVWVRVTVDGQKVLERELPPDTRIPLTPTSQVTVRAGDAGAVRVAIAGKDQGPVGRDGEVATRTFAVTAAAGK